MLTMSKNTNCFRVHPDVEPGPCVYCSKRNISKRYFTNLRQIILIYLKMPVYNVCRKCYLKFILYFLGQKNVLMNHACLHRRKHAKTILAFCLILMHVTINLTTINTTLFDRAFDISVINKFPTSNENYKTALCHVHYNKFNHYINDSSVFKSSNTKRFVKILDENNDLFLKYRYIRLKLFLAEAGC